VRSSPLKWLTGGLVFFLPTLTVVVGGTIFHADVREAFWVSIVLAAIIPPALVLSSSAKWRVLSACGLWLLLALQVCLILLSLLAGFRG
jgi:hypothetical protein